MSLQDQQAKSSGQPGCSTRRQPEQKRGGRLGAGAAEQLVLLSPLWTLTWGPGWSAEISGGCVQVSHGQVFCSACAGAAVLEILNCLHPRGGYERHGEELR